MWLAAFIAGDQLAGALWLLDVRTMPPSTRRRRRSLGLGSRWRSVARALLSQLDEHADGVGAVGGAGEDVGGVAVGVDDADEFGDLVFGGGGWT